MLIASTKKDSSHCWWHVLVPIIIASVLVPRQGTTVIALSLRVSNDSTSKEQRSNNRSNNLLILGLGNVGTEVATLAASGGTFVGNVGLNFNKIYGTVRSETSSLSDKIETIEFCRLDHPSSLESILTTCSHVLVTIPAPPSVTETETATKEEENSDNNAMLDQIYDKVVEVLPEHAWIGIVSTTGVYGNHNGQWVQEDSPLLCQNGTSAADFRNYEMAWQSRVRTSRNNNNRHCDLYIFRCAGIYGPNQSALHTVYKRGLGTATAGDGITNRIHLTDIARAILGSMRNHMNKENEQPDSVVRVYNLADDLPEARPVVMKYAAQCLESIGVVIPTGAPGPSPTAGAGAAATSTMTNTRRQRRQTEQKLVNNSRMKEELLSEGLLYPTYKEGLKAILKMPNRPWSDQAKEF